MFGGDSIPHHPTFLRTDVGNIIIGVLFIIGGLSGQFALLGTNSPMALVAVGVALVAWGGFQVVRSRR